MSLLLHNGCDTLGEALGVRACVCGDRGEVHAGRSRARLVCVQCSQQSSRDGQPAVKGAYVTGPDAATVSIEDKRLARAARQRVI